AYKTANKLIQIVARIEAEEAGADDALLLNTYGEVAESASANLFWIGGGNVWTPPFVRVCCRVYPRHPFSSCARSWTWPAASNRSRARATTRRACSSLSTLGIVREVVAIDGRRVRTSEVTDRLWRAYCDLLARETA
ncbi:MAG: aminotransferase class IV, partial [Verrucomicrobiales bacterium]|nr:aminotransferase class IV [Verrucomicrobiales bacterium]